MLTLLIVGGITVLIGGVIAVAAYMPAGPSGSRARRQLPRPAEKYWLCGCAKYSPLTLAVGYIA